MTVSQARMRLMQVRDLLDDQEHQLRVLRQELARTLEALRQKENRVIALEAQERSARP